MSKEITGFRPGSRSWKKFMAKVYGWGASIVIIGALFKLEHYKGASIMLIIGLGTEALIFFLSAFEPIHEDPDWSLVYPELAEDYDGPGGRSSVKSSISPTQQLDNMLEQAKIGPELIESLGKGLQRLADTTAEMNKLGDVSEATNDFIGNMKEAAEKVHVLSNNYENAAQALSGLSAATDEGASYAENIRKVNESLSSMSRVYEMQLENAQNHNEVTKEMYNNMTALVENLSNSVEDTKRYKENIAKLSDNLESLNTVYGNMLSAMNINR